jgi:hypothetical protein
MSIDWTMLVATQSVVQEQVLATSVRRYSNESAGNSGKLVNDDALRLRPGRACCI